MGWTTKGSEFESRWAQEFSLLHVVQIGSGTHPVSYPMGTGGLFPGVKRPHHQLVLRLRERLHGVMLN
jgi:hypothetical protein